MASPYEVGVLWFVSLAVSVAAFGAYAGARAAATVALLLGVAGAVGWLRRTGHGRRRTARVSRAGARGAQEGDGLAASFTQGNPHLGQARGLSAPPPCVVAACLLIPLVVAVVGWPLWTIAVIFFTMFGISISILWAIFGPDGSGASDGASGGGAERDRGEG